MICSDLRLIRLNQDVASLFCDRLNSFGLSHSNALMTEWNKAGCLIPDQYLVPELKPSNTHLILVD
jgi:hypothetical protein